MFDRAMLFCIRISVAGCCGVIGMAFGCVFAFMLFAILYLFGISGSQLDPIGLFLEAILGIIFFVGGFHITEKPYNFIKRHLP